MIFQPSSYKYGKKSPADKYVKKTILFFKILLSLFAMTRR